MGAAVVEAAEHSRRSIRKYRLTSLTTLNIGENQLVALPDSIAALTALERLGLSWNQLVTLPDSIAALTVLKTLNLMGNPLAKPQSSAVEAWLTAVFSSAP